jgi:hypothetical protein
MSKDRIRDKTRFPERVAFVCQRWLKDQLENDAREQDKSLSELIRQRISVPYQGPK